MYIALFRLMQILFISKNHCVYWIVTGAMSFEESPPWTQYMDAQGIIHIYRYLVKGTLPYFLRESQRKSAS